MAKIAEGQRVMIQAEGYTTFGWYVGRAPIFRSCHIVLLNRETGLTGIVTPAETMQAVAQ